MLSPSSYGALEEGDANYPNYDEVLISPLSKQKSEPGQGKVSFYKYIALGALLVASMVLASSYSSLDSFKSSSPLFKESSGSTDSLLTFTFYRNGYSPILDFAKTSSSNLNYVFLSSYDAVIEPYASMYLMIKSGGSDDSSVYYSYTATSDSDSSQVYSATYYPSDANSTTALTIDCEPYSTYSILVSEYSSDGDLIDSTTGSAMCMYVRREIRSLTDSDLFDFMDAMAVLWFTDKETGQSLYGDDYISGSNLLEVHYFQSSWPDSDHSHEGQGFLSSHVTMTNMLESSLQLVNAAVTIPYWDFTIESALGIPVYESPMFTAETFGSISARSSWNYTTSTILEGAIQDGRFAYLTIANNTQFPQFTGGYGYLRSPWASNPSPYITRYTSTSTSIPTCESHYDALETTAMNDFLGYLPVDPHANTHMITAGQFGCELLDTYVDQGIISNSSSVCRHWLMKQKFYHRYHYAVLKSDCYVIDDDYTNSDNFICGYECDETSDGKETFYSLFNSYYTDSVNTTGKESLRQFFCGGDAHKIITGDMYLSSSAGDPSFWPIHGTLERLYHAKRLAGGFTTDTYVTELDEVCSYYECYDWQTGVYGNFTSCCEGHFSDSRLFDYTLNSRTDHIGSTNLETLTNTDASSSSYSMSYIYDSFTWDHCSSTYDINALLVTLSG